MALIQYLKEDKDMQLLRKNSTKQILVGKSLTSLEYGFDEKALNVAIVAVHGRSPEVGRVMNTVCKELVYIKSGSGTVEVEGKITNVTEGDVVLIQPEEKYFWQGNLTAIISAHPAWFPEQHRIIED
jgi:mannose-6-phosphate isomerase-like protein (cupin superfamily)